VVLTLLAALVAGAALATDGTCPANGMPLPSAAERQAIIPITLLRCFLPEEEIDTIIGSYGHDAQSAAVGAQYDSGRLNPDGSLRPPLSDAELAALGDLHLVLDADVHEGAVVRKFVPNAAVGGYLYGQTVISSNGALLVVSTDTVRGFVGLERNTLDLDAGAAIAVLGLDYETTATGQFTDADGMPPHRLVAVEVQQHGLHSIRHLLSASAASAAQIPLARNLNDYVQRAVPSLDGRSFEMDRAGQDNPYTGLGLSRDIGMRVLQDEEEDYPPRIADEDVMTSPTPLAAGDLLIRRSLNGDEAVIATYVEVTADGGTTTDVWQLSSALSAADTAYYAALTARAAAQVAAVAH
jgi:hypothetical protein